MHLAGGSPLWGEGLGAQEDPQGSLLGFLPVLEGDTPEILE